MLLSHLLSPSSSHLLLRCPISSPVATPLIYSRRPCLSSCLPPPLVTRSHHRLSTIALRHSSAGRRHQTIASCLLPKLFRVTSCPQPSSLLVCCHCTLLWLIVKSLCAGHRLQTIPFRLPPKLSPCCLLSAAVVSLLAPPAVPSFDPLPPSLLIAPRL